MRKALVLSILTLCAAPAEAAAGAHCDGTPFSLGKPAAEAPKAQAPVAKPKPAPKVAVAKPAAKPQAKQRLLAACKDKKKRA